MRFVTNAPPKDVSGCFGTSSSSITFDGFPIDCELKALFELPFDCDGSSSSSSGNACAEMPFGLLQVPPSSFRPTDSCARLTQPVFVDADSFCLLPSFVVYAPNLLSGQQQQEQQPFRLRTSSHSDHPSVPSVIVVIRRRACKFE